jgi:hypothetical protein
MQFNAGLSSKIHQEPFFFVPDPFSGRLLLGLLSERHCNRQPARAPLWFDRLSVYFAIMSGELDWRDLITRHLVGRGCSLCLCDIPWWQKRPSETVSPLHPVEGPGWAFHFVSTCMLYNLSAQDARPRDPLEQLHLMGESGDIDAHILANKEVIMANIKKALHLPIPEPPGT